MSKTTQSTTIVSNRQFRRMLLVALSSAIAGCAGSEYYARDRQQDNTDYANRVSCPGDTLPVCFERGGEITHCRCTHDTELGTVLQY